MILLQCEDKCGLSFETRQANCVTLKGEIYPDSFCPKNRVPDLVRKCNTSAPCKHEWFISQWSEVILVKYNYNTIKILHFYLNEVHLKKIPYLI